jgi:hypothetical protein
MTILLLVNLLLVVVSTGYAVFASFRPGVLTSGLGAETPPSKFYAQMYAIRGVPLGIATAVIILVNLATPGVTRWWLVVSGLVQLGDAALAIRHRMRGMTIGAGIAGVVHLVSAALV